MTEHPLIRREGHLQWEVTQEALDAAAAAAAVEVEGVEAPVPPRGTTLRRGRLVDVGDDGLRVSLGVRCRYGVVLPDTARAVQARVATRLAHLTGLPVEAVDVTVLGVTRS
jgi:uncharacterized alkaline shock family protein YloU